MNTPIYDFAKKYAESGAVRAHMPGHKGIGNLGVEALDITEITGADSLYEACGIIRESEENASRLFGAHTFYSTEGSSLAIRAMLAIVVKYAALRGKAPTVLAARNVHKSFVYASALVGAKEEWIYSDSFLSCELSPDRLEARIAECDPVAVYLTSPDYLGRVADISALAKICHAHGVLLLVDNAHGAYLKFLTPSRHPIDLGADVVCDSAHKTLPVLTGGGYLHISNSAPRELVDFARSSMELFGSTSPSYLILESLDLANRAISEGYAERIRALADKADNMRRKLNTGGYVIISDESLKLTFCAKEYGYSGGELATLLEERGIYPEFYDPDYLVLMLTPELRENELSRIEDTFLSIPRRAPMYESAPFPPRLERVLSPREALFAPSESVPVSNSVGRILAAASVGCPPAVPIAISGERIDGDTARAFEYYGISDISVVK